MAKHYFLARARMCVRHEVCVRRTYMRIMPKCEQDVGRNEWGCVAGRAADVGRKRAEFGRPKRDEKL